ncbi:hypothetical protein Tco_0750260 [Tanacetum coccineum]|uniref:Uncharacterized protein n=1 Tax=Tanacetum coccineum TaxID=301880 RepID=A0ABQ4Z0Q7_9ASTR
MKTKRRLVPKSVGVSSGPLPVEHSVVAQGYGVSAIPFDTPYVWPKVSAPCVREEANVPLKKTSIRPLYSSSCTGQQPCAALGVSAVGPSVGKLNCVSLVGPSVGQSKCNASSQDAGHNVFDIGPTVPSKRLYSCCLTDTHSLPQPANPVNVNTSSVPIDEHHDHVRHGVHIGAVRIPLPDRGFRHPVTLSGSRQAPTVNTDTSQQHSRQAPTGEERLKSVPRSSRPRYNRCCKGGRVVLRTYQTLKIGQYGVSKVNTAYWMTWRGLQEENIQEFLELLLRYGILGSLGMAYWLFRYIELVENVLLMVFDHSIIYGVFADVDTAYSSKSSNGPLARQVLDTHGYAVSSLMDTAYWLSE